MGKHNLNNIINIMVIRLGPMMLLRNNLGIQVEGKTSYGRPGPIDPMPLPKMATSNDRRPEAPRRVYPRPGIALPGRDGGGYEYEQAEHRPNYGENKHKAQLLGLSMIIRHPKRSKKKNKTAKNLQPEGLGRADPNCDGPGRNNRHSTTRKRERVFNCATHHCFECKCTQDCPQTLGNYVNCSSGHGDKAH